MEFYEELLLTALISVLLAFLIGKLAAAGATEDEADHQSATLSTAPPARADVKLERGEGSLLIEQVAEKLGSSVVAFETEVNDDRLERIKELETENRDKVGEVRMEESSGKELDKEVEIERIGDAGSCREGRRLVKEEVVVEKVVEEVIVQLGGEEEVEVTEDVAVSGGDERGGSFLHGEDEWEGIERSELEKLFGVAIDYVGGKKGRETVSKLSSEVQMQLYGLHKIATEGPCYEPQPMALKVTARAKWQAWQRLGSMNPESAMEEYISLLTDSVPGWKEEMPGGGVKQNDGSDHPAVGDSRIEASVSGLSLQHKPHPKAEMLQKDSSYTESDTDHELSSSKFKQGLTSTLIFNLLSPPRVTFISF